MRSARQDLKSVAAHVLKNTTPEEAVVLAWPLVCGSKVAERVRALSFGNGTLRVAVPDRGWQSELREFTPQYLDRLSTLAGVEVKRIAYDIAPSSAARSSV